MTDAARDRLWAGSAGLLAFGLYVRTLAPGLIGIVDTPMFQFIGRVLGVAHNPGYPLYVLLTYPISLIPIASLAWRVNLFSAVSGAAAVVLVYYVGRRLGARPVISAAAALSLAFGRTFWSQAVIAEVYTLNAAFVAAVLLLMLTWRDTKRPAALYGAIAVFAVGLGNHLTILGLLPGMVLFVGLCDPAVLRRPILWLRSAGLVLAGLLPYGLILVRSRQPGAYVESPAQSLAELGGVMSGAQFTSGLFAFEWQTVWSERLPFVLHRIVVPELSWAGLALAGAGVAFLGVRQRPAAAMLLTKVVLITAFIANYDVIDPPVFMIPVFVIAWPLAGVALEQIVRRVAGLGGARLTAAVALAMPAWLLLDNFERNDRSRAIAERIYFERLFDAIPDGSVLAREDYLIDRMVMYMLLGEGHAERKITAAPVQAEALVDRARSGIQVYAFPAATRRLRLDGLDLDFSPLRLSQGSLGQFHARLPPGAAAALAVPAIHAATFAAVVPAAAPQLRTPAAGITMVTSGQLPHGFDLHADELDAAITYDGREVVRASAGAVLAVWHADGTLAGTFVLPASDAFEVPFDTGPLSVRRVRGEMPKIDVPAGECRAVTAVLDTGTVVVYLPEGAALSLSMASNTPLATRVADQSTADLGVAVEADGARLRLTAPAGEPAAAILALGAVPLEGRACVSAGTSTPAGALAKVMRQDTRGLLRRVEAAEVLGMHRDEQSQLVGAGWSTVDVDAGGPFRWLTSSNARLLLPLLSADVERIELDLLLATPATDAGPVDITIRLNDGALESQPATAGWARYVWSVPPGLLTAGTNSLVLGIEPLRGDRSVALGAVTVVDRPAR